LGVAVAGVDGESHLGDSAAGRGDLKLGSASRSRPSVRT
jgi:hypothetical protein